MLGNLLMVSEETAKLRTSESRQADMEEG